MTARWKASLPKRGERTRKGPSWRRILSPVSFLIFLCPLLLASVTDSRAERSVILAGPLQELRSHYELADLEVNWKISTGLADALQNLGALSWEWTVALPSNCPDRVVLKIKAATETEESSSGRMRSPEYIVSGQTEVHRTGYRTTRTLRAGSLVLDADVELSEGWVSPSAWTVNGEDDVVGSYVRATIGKGAFVRRTELRERPLIQKGHEVRVEFRGTGILVTSRATSRRDAWLGDSIQVRIVGAGKDCRALVSGPNLVVVERRRP